MKYLIIALLIIGVMATNAQAEWKGKVGYSDMTCDYIQPGISLELGYEFRGEMLGLEGNVGFESHRINQVGQINTLKVAVLGKIYPAPWLWIGGGIGWLDNYVVENYSGEADIDDEVCYLAVVGWDIRDGWFVEVEGRVADLDIETFLPYETDIERHSRLNSVMFKVGRRF